MWRDCDKSGAYTVLLFSGKSEWVPHATPSRVAALSSSLLLGLCCVCAGLRVYCRVAVLLVPPNPYYVAAVRLAGPTAPHWFWPRIHSPTTPKTKFCGAKGGSRIDGALASLSDSAVFAGMVVLAFVLVYESHFPDPDLE